MKSAYLKINTSWTLSLLLHLVAIVSLTMIDSVACAFEVNVKKFDSSALQTSGDGTANLATGGYNSGGGGDPMANTFIDEADLLCEWILRSPMLDQFPELTHCREKILLMRESLNNSSDQALVQFTPDDLNWKGVPKPAVFLPDGTIKVSMRAWEAFTFEEQLEIEAFELAGLCGSRKRYDFGSLVRKSGFIEIWGRIPVRTYEPNIIIAQDLVPLTTDELIDLRHRLLQKRYADQRRHRELALEIQERLRDFSPLLQQYGLDAKFILEFANSIKELAPYIRRAYGTPIDPARVAAFAPLIQSLQRTEREFDSSSKTNFARPISIKNVENALSTRLAQEGISDVSLDMGIKTYSERRKK